MKPKITIEKITIYNKPEESPGYLLWRVSSRWRGAIEDTLKPLDLTHPQFVILATIGWLTKDHAKISQIDISKAAELDPNTTSQILRGLEKKELITRVRRLDERSKNPKLTLLGMKKLALAMPAVETTDTLFFSSLTKEQSASLNKIFLKLIKP